MKILVPIKRVPDPYGRVRISTDGTLDYADTKWVINPFDEIAIEEAVRIRESAGDVEIVAVSVGELVCEEQLRTALAMGADRAVLAHESRPLDPQGISKLLAALARKENPDIVLLGKQAIDDDFNQTGQRIAAILGIGQATFASRVEVAADRSAATVTREVDAGRETVRVGLPAVITTDLRLNSPRYVALPAIIKARSKTLDRMPSAALCEVPNSLLEIVKRENPPVRKPGRKLSSVDELVAALRNVAKVI
ncbi:MAG TPA: electron transfer flavoprotein subunit beta/FixA family protein [Chthonomonadales bacterium]|nr:electron transfer flavoprotein subunit beta/FixA family protein [Chthonomonadales bacterium]